MGNLILGTEAKVFCLAILVFLLFFKLKSTLSVSKKTIAAYLTAILGIALLILSGFLTAKLYCYGGCSLLYGAAFFLAFAQKKKAVWALGAVLVCGCTLLTLYYGLNLATYGLIFAAVLQTILEQFRLIRTDNLTGLYNLYARKLELEEQEREYKRDHTDSFYVFSCDLNKFKTINDTWGHAEGDRALELVAKALKKVGQKFDAKVFRVGGDEFQIIADTADEALAEQIEVALHEEFDRIRFREDFEIEISVGKVLYKGEAEPEDILEVADSRMYANKRKSKE